MNHLTNWAGNYAYRASTVHRPESIDEVREIVGRATRIHALGSRHGFNDIADSAELISLDAIELPVAIDREAMTVTVNASIRYGTLAACLQAQGFALHNTASLPHISVIGAVATATHGSGDALGNLSTAVTAVELVTSAGDMLTVRKGDPDFAGMVVGIGALGVVTRLTLAIEPTYDVRQVVYEDLAWDQLDAHFDEVMAAGTSVSLFLDWGDAVNTVLVKQRVEQRVEQGSEGKAAVDIASDLFGAPAATRYLHPVKSLPADNCTLQMGVPGPWCERLPHFRMDSVPAAGDDIQAEYMVARSDALAVMRAFQEAIQPYRDALWISEIRSVAADDLWLSSAYGRDTVCLHTSFRHDQAAVDRIVPVIEAALEPFGPRPHWSKVFAATAGDLAGRYPKMAEFRNLAARLDPRGAFRNEFLEQRVLGKSD